jgi:AraC-like DNA-binding protein
MSLLGFADVVLGLERRAPGEEIARHRHCAGYAALLLSGSYIEAGEDGHFEVSAGNVVFHGPFHAHCDCIGERGAVILNLALPPWFEPNIALGRVSNPDQVVTCAEKGAAQALSQILEEAVPLVSEEMGWPHELSRAIHRDSSLSLSSWAEQRGLSRTQLSRGFSQVFGVPAGSYRAQIRARKSLEADCSQ